MQLDSKENALWLSETDTSHAKKTVLHTTHELRIHGKSNLSVTCASPSPLQPYRRPREYIKHLLHPKIFSGNRVNVVPAVRREVPQGDALGGSGDRSGIFQLSDDKLQTSSGEELDGSVVATQHRRHRGRRRRRTVRVRVNTVCDLVCSILWLIYVMSHVIMGSLYLHQCPAAPFIPCYLVTIGALQVVRAVWSALDSSCQEGVARYISDTVWTAADALLCITEVSVFTTGCVVIYGLKSLSFDPSDHHYCNPGIYWFAITSVTVVIAVLLTVGLSICLFHCWTTYERAFAESQGQQGTTLNM